ncbi:MAG: carbohydrate ABC transporter permease [Anaerolineae bacterium]
MLTGDRRNLALRGLRRNTWIYLVLALPTVHFLVYRVYPVIRSLMLSFYDYQVFDSRWIGLQNYERLITDDIFRASLWNTIYYTLGTVPIGLFLSLVLAAFIVSAPSGAQSFFKSAYYLPGVASAVVLSMVWRWIFNPNVGLLNYLLSLVGVEPLRWLADPKLAMPSLIIMVLAGGQGLSIILLSAAMNSIPRELYEAGHIDGATAWAEFRHITMPLVQPSIVYLLITGTIGAFQAFTTMYIMTGGGPGYATMTIVYVIYRFALERLQYGLASTMSVFLLVVTVVLSLVQYRMLGGSVEY